MGQDKISGMEANKWGHMMAANVARYLGIQSLSHISNEASFNGKRIVIKSAHHRTPRDWHFQENLKEDRYYYSRS